MKVTFVFSLFLLTILISNGCKKESKPLDASFILQEYSVSNENYICVDSLKNINFNHIDSLLINNININSDTFMSYLSNQLEQFDKLLTNKETVNYLKAIYLADFIYSAFSFQFLGDELGLKNDSIDHQGWNSLSLEKQFKAGNTNMVAVSCGARTIFYKKLVKQLLGLPVRDTSIENIHTYPIVKISEKEFLIDPSEPIVFFDSKLQRVLTFEELKIAEEVIFKRTKRSFGTTHHVVSSKLIQQIDTLGSDFKESILNYLSLNTANISKLTPKCFRAKFKKQWTILKVDNDFNKFAIQLDRRNIGLQLSKEVFVEHYFGVNCETLLN